MSAAPFSALDYARDGFPPNGTSTVAISCVRFTSIFLKNSNFRLDHNSEDRWQSRWKFTWGLSGATDLSAYDPLLGLAVATTREDNTMRTEAGFSRHLNFRLFQHRVIGGNSSARADSIGGDLEEETRDGLFCWPRYLDG
jgi:hypothetical protein